MMILRDLVWGLYLFYFDNFRDVNVAKQPGTRGHIGEMPWLAGSLHLNLWTPLMDMTHPHYIDKIN
jgi:hypothetical protein